MPRRERLAAAARRPASRGVAGLPSHGQVLHVYSCDTRDRGHGNKPHRHGVMRVVVNGDINRALRVLKKKLRLERRGAPAAALRKAARKSASALGARGSSPGSPTGSREGGGRPPPGHCAASLSRSSPPINRIATTPRAAAIPAGSTSDVQASPSPFPVPPPAAILSAWPEKPLRTRRGEAYGPRLSPPRLTSLAEPCGTPLPTEELHVLPNLAQGPAAALEGRM
jgi:hypothetical protein